MPRGNRGTGHTSTETTKQLSINLEKQLLVILATALKKEEKGR